MFTKLWEKIQVMFSGNLSCRGSTAQSSRPTLLIVYLLIISLSKNMQEVFAFSAEHWKVFRLSLMNFNYLQKKQACQNYLCPAIVNGGFPCVCIREERNFLI